MDQRNRNILLAIVLSVFFHIAVIYMIDFFDWLNSKLDTIPESAPTQMTVVFPENKPDDPKTIVENQNENDIIPDDSKLLSDKNSQARNPNITDINIKNTPKSDGNVDNQNLSSPILNEKTFRPNNKPFSRNALTGKQIDPNKNREEYQENPQDSQQAREGSNQRFQQKHFSVEEVGALSLSTYAWEWAPYINKLKRKHARVWFAPPAYSRLGLIYGQTVIVFEIARNGSLVRAEIIDHRGHESLETASFGSIKAIFPFLPLPENFPDETLTITATLIYPDLKKLSKERRR